MQHIYPVPSQGSQSDSAGLLLLRLARRPFRASAVVGCGGDGKQVLPGSVALHNDGQETGLPVLLFLAVLSNQY